MAVRRFYWELVRYRAAGGLLSPAAALATKAAAGALRALRARAGPSALRVACMVELVDDDVARAALARDVARAREAAAAAGVGLDVWPQLPDGEGRYLNARTAQRFGARLWPLVDAIPGGAPGVGLALDLEPSARLLRAAWACGGPAAALPLALARHGPVVVDEIARAAAAGRSGRRALRALRAEASARGLDVHVAVMPPVGGARAAPLLRALVGCGDDDEDGPIFERVAAMCYVPMLRRTRADRDGERRALRAWAARHRRASDAIALGPCSTGVLGDEPVYARVDELREDVRAVVALGFDDVALFSLEGLWYGREGAPRDDGFAPTRPDWTEWADAVVGE